MNPQIGTLTLWSNPVLGNNDGVYNTIVNTAISTLGAGVTFNNVTVRSSLIVNTLSIQYNDNTTPQRFTYARFVGGGQTVFYFVQESTVTQNVLHITLLLDPFATFPNLEVAGVTARMHSNQQSPLHNDYLLSYDPEDSFINKTNIGNSLGQLLNPTRRIIITNVDINNSNLQAWASNPTLNTNLPGGSIPLVTSSLTFPINTTPTTSFNVVKQNTGAWELNALTQSRLEMLQRLNMAHSIQFVYQLPQGVALIGATPISNISFNTLQTNFSIASPYIGTNAPLRRKTRIVIQNVGTGDTLVNFGWEFTNDTATLLTSALCTPEGNAFHYYSDASLNGFGNLGATSFFSRMINSPGWNSGLLDLVSPAGERFASIQSQMQRESQNHAFNVQNRQNEWQRDQDAINAIRAHVSSVTTAAGALSSVGNAGSLLSMVSGAASAFTLNDTLTANRNQIALNNRRTSEQASLNSAGNTLTLGQINQQEAVRRTVSPSRVSSPATNLQSTGIGQSMVITREVLHPEDQAKLDRLYNAFGFNIQRYVTSLPQPRSIHNFFMFENVTVNVTNNPLIGRLAEVMLTTGLRIWRVNPTIQGIYNNF